MKTFKLNPQSCAGQQGAQNHPQEQVWSQSTKTLLHQKEKVRSQRIFNIIYFCILYFQNNAPMTGYILSKSWLNK